MGSGVCLDMHRVGVPAGLFARLEHDQLVIAMQQVRDIRARRLPRR